MSLRIAHFVQRYPPALGGAEAYFARLSRFLVAQGERVTVFTTTALALEAFWSRRAPCLEPGTETVDGVLVRRYALDWRFRGRRILFKALSLLPIRTWQLLLLGCNPISWRMWRETRDTSETFDVVHATAFPYTWPIVCGLRLARRLRVPFLLTPFLHLGEPDNPHDSTRRAYTRPVLRSLLQAADVVFAQTPSERDALRACGVAPEKIVLQGLGVDASECTGGDRERFRAQWQIGADETVIGHLANLSEEKGSADLLPAAQRLWQRGMHCRIALAGPAMPNFETAWKALARTGNRGHAVLRLGVLSEEQKRDFYAGVDVFALPSRSDSFGLVLLEAWANGLPNVAYRAGGIADVIRHEQDGLLVRCGDVDGLADALGRLISDRDLRAQLGLTGHERTQHDFRWPDKLQLVRRAYQDMARPSPGASPRAVPL